VYDYIMLMEAERALERLREAVDGLDIPPEGDAIAEALALRSALDARIARAVAAFDATRLWDLDAATSAIAWLRDHGGLSRRVAARTASMARRVAALPVTAGAWADGTLSEGQVEAIVANVSAATAPLFAAQEAEVVPALVPLSVADTGRAMGVWAARADTDGATPPEPERALHLSPALDGRWLFDGDLDAEGG
jgi:hypothetical protein